MNKYKKEVDFVFEHNIPQSLYKFACFDHENHYIELIRNNTLYFSAPQDFNDPFDCNLYPDFSNLTDDQFKEMLDGLAEYEQSHNKGYTFKTLIDTQDIDVIRNNSKKGRKGNQKSFNEVLGISCFCESNDSLLMWSHYAKGHRGFCLEFDGTLLQRYFSLVLRFPIILKHVFYPETYPIFHLPVDLKEWFESTALVKSNVWKYEREWRLIYIGGPKRKLQYIDNMLKGIYLGVGCTNEDIDLIKCFIRDKSPKPKLYQGRMADCEFKIVFEEIPNT